MANLLVKAISIFTSSFIAICLRTAAVTVEAALIVMACVYLLLCICGQFHCADVKYVQLKYWQNTSERHGADKWTAQMDSSVCLKTIKYWHKQYSVPLSWFKSEYCYLLRQIHLELFRSFWLRGQRGSYSSSKLYLLIGLLEMSYVLVRSKIGGGEGV